MATYRRFISGPAWETVLTSNITTAGGVGLTTVTINLSDGTQLTFTGSGITVSSGQMTAGVIASMTHRNGGTNIETTTGLGDGAGVPAATVQTFLTPAVNGAGLQAFFMSGDDNVFGSTNAETLFGGAGADFFRGGAGADTLNGGAGNDMAAYDTDPANGVIVNLSGATANGVAANRARDAFGAIDTLIGIEQARGGGGADIFIGGTGYNFFQGRGGADSYRSSIARYYDNYYVGDFSWVDYRQDGGPAGININLGAGSGSDTNGFAESFVNIVAIRGSMNGDTIVGDQYFNYFQTLAGNDTVNGGTGADVADYSRDAEFGGLGAVTVNLATGVATDGFGATDTLSNVEFVYGTSAGADTLTGNASDNQLRGLGGNDALVGNDGFDDLRPGLGVDTVNGAAGANGDESYDDIDRVTYNDLAPDAAGLGVIVNLSAANVTFEGRTVAALRARDTGGSIDTLIDIERARGTSGRDYFVGSATANLRQEGFEGLAGNDYFDGGAGFNVVRYHNDDAFGSTMGVIVNLSASAIVVNGVNVAAGRARDSFGATDTLINIRGIFGTNFADHVVGGAGYDLFRSFGGADFFNGGAGDRDEISFFNDDLLHGVTGAGAVVNMQAGTATTWLDATTTTFANVEDLQGSERNDTITGSAGANRIAGETGADNINGAGGDDFINGGPGNNTLNGGADFDVVHYLYNPGYGAYQVLQRSFHGFTTPWTGVTVNLATGTATNHAGGTDTLAGFEGVGGTFLSDTLIGDGNANTFFGFSGNDTIDGAGGTDTISFADFGATNGSGAPALPGQNASRPNGVTVNLATGVVNDSEGGTDAVSNIEDVIGSVGNDAITGSAQVNRLEGRDGADTLNGGAGADTTVGGAGNDFHIVDNAGDLVFEAVGGGTDRVAGGANWVLQAGQEVEIITPLSYTGTTAINFSGNEFNQSLFGNDGANILDGRAGVDAMFGNGGNDIFLIDAAADLTFEAVGDGVDRAMTSVSYSLRPGQEVETLHTTLPAGVTALNLFGNEFGQAVIGNAGVNIVNGGLGNDSLTGGGGNDTFFFNTALNAATNVDAVVDFSVPQDTIRLDDAVFAGLATGLLAAGAFNTGAAATQADDRIIYNTANGALIFDADGLGGAAGTRFATLSAGLAMTNGDFVVV